MGWWCNTLVADICEEHEWKAPDSALAHMLVDARGSPAHCAAVLFVNGQVHFTDGAPSEAVMARFRQRADNQIMSLEMLAISVGLATFAAELRGRKVIVYSDNTGAEVCWLCLACVSGLLLLVCRSAQGRALRGAGIIVKWFMRFGPRLSWARRGSGSSAFPRTTIWLTCRHGKSMHCWRRCMPSGGNQWLHSCSWMVCNSLALSSARGYNLSPSVQSGSMQCLPARWRM